MARFDGFIASYLGDGLLIYFGYPKAHGDDTERAVRAGLAIVEKVAALELPGEIRLQTRVGIATGLVMVGDLVGKELVWERAVIGETPNLAARLQAIALPDTVVIAPSTRRLIGEMFEYEELGEFELKGFADRIEVCRVVAEREVASRFEAFRYGSFLTPLVGRDGELASLMRLFEEAKNGKGNVALVTGEAGIGKSRLCEALRRTTAGDPRSVLNASCFQHHLNSPLRPIIAMIERAAAIRQKDFKISRCESSGHC